MYSVISIRMKKDMYIHAKFDETISPKVRTEDRNKYDVLKTITMCYVD
jgi:hypothetical protein